MKTEARIFLVVMVFFLIVGGVYLPWSHDVIGGTALLLSAGLVGMCGTYFAFIARRMAPRPEDRPDAEIAEGAGELGFFSPGSYWPIGIAAASTVTALGAAYWSYWMLVLGVVLLLMAAGGLLFEYYVK